MSKLIPASLGAVGAGGAGIGGYMLLNPSENQKTEKVITFKEKYKGALLDLEGDKDSAIWESKFTLLKSGSPHHPSLKGITTKEDTEAKSLHKQGCRDLYNSPADNNHYLEDFKNYCAKLIGDVVSGSWIEGEQTQTGTKWDGKLKDIKSKKDNLISSVLKELAGKLTSSGETFTENERKLLEGWCHARKKDLSQGEENSLLEEIKSYCISS
ncbi:hypothetical protein HF1_03810 [Mycoplasma haemofelis str. Langford 1]|uniref:Uncharacterized protein n=1 Tax=Mycoplasma haemofelis (strain Langford 1) TaxID=941640 RepID=E8ZGW8_MYCHL|nr:hypothetical protein [Mycoplasma haemofelis]CBY92389.1 hypothetical protein HF1_03810 [Mycoplasma haemofelis str. Langford 1]